MSDAKRIYASDAERYEDLVSHEDYQGNIERALDQIIKVETLDVVDLGAGTGRLASLLAPRAGSMRAFDLSSHMLQVTRQKFAAMRRRAVLAAADHRRIPLAKGSVDLVISGWSVSYLAVWNPHSWEAELEDWLAETMRVLRPRGMVVLLESLGTGYESPFRLPHLENVYTWLDGVGFSNTWIRTDYRFDSAKQAAELAGFFFGEEMGRKVSKSGSAVLPECTGLWWKRAS